jgi:hypothetical protein
MNMRSAPVVGRLAPRLLLPSSPPHSHTPQDPAFQIGRKAILDFLNNTFQMRLTKIEETSTGEPLETGRP